MSGGLRMPRIVYWRSFRTTFLEEKNLKKVKKREKKDDKISTVKYLNLKKKKKRIFFALPSRRRNEDLLDLKRRRSSVVVIDREQFKAVSHTIWICWKAMTTEKPIKEK